MLLGKFGKITEDYKFNLKVIEERDAELSMHQNWFENCRKALLDKDSEISDLKVIIILQE